MSAKPPVQEPWQVGNLRGAVLWFEDAGDTLPLHSHPEGSCHVTFVRQGKFRVLGPGVPPIWNRVLRPGDMVKFEPGQEHEYVALLPDSKIINIIY